MLAYTLGNFLRRLTRPKAVMEWSLRSVQLTLVKTGARLVRHARHLVFQMAEVAVPRDVWGNAGAHWPLASGARMTLGCWGKWVGVTGSGSGVCLNLLKTGIWSERRVSQVVRGKRRR